MVAFETVKLDISGPPRIKILYPVPYVTSLYRICLPLGRQFEFLTCSKALSVLSCHSDLDR